MKQTNKNLVFCILAVAALLVGCGESGSKNITTGSSRKDVVPIKNEFGGGTNFQGNQIGGLTGESVLIGIDLEPDFQQDFAVLNMEIDLGTVIGEDGELDANQGGDITFHKTYHNGIRDFSFYTSGGNVKNDVKENYWHFNDQGDFVWRGVFEGRTGALVVVVDGVFESGDGNDPFDYMSGSVWFRPWPVVADTGINSDKCFSNDRGLYDCKNPAGPPSRCWNVSLGPYDCRFDVSGDSKTVTAVGNRHSDEAYVKVGTFNNLSRQLTFKEDY